VKLPLKSIKVDLTQSSWNDGGFSMRTTLDFGSNEAYQYAQTITETALSHSKFDNYFDMVWDHMGYEIKKALVNELELKSKDEKELATILLNGIIHNSKNKEK